MPRLGGELLTTTTIVAARLGGKLLARREHTKRNSPHQSLSISDIIPKSIQHGDTTLWVVFCARKLYKPFTKGFSVQMAVNHAATL